MSLGDEVPERQWTAELRAMAHPVRLRVLSLLTGGPMTAAEVAREMNLTHANASYHLRQLLAAGTIQVAGEERIRGGVAQRYRYDLERDLRLEGKPPIGPEHLRHRGQLYRRGRDRAAPAHPAGPPDDRDASHLTDAELWVDARGRGRGSRRR